MNGIRPGINGVGGRGKEGVAVLMNEERYRVLSV